MFIATNDMSIVENLALGDLALEISILVNLFLELLVLVLMVLRLLNVGLLKFGFVDCSTVILSRLI
jgi:hypothetical protein